MVEIEGENMRGVTWEFIEDNKQGDLGIGGKLLHACEVCALQRGIAA